MTVKELITKLRTYDPNTPIVYRCCSEWNTLKAEDLEIIKLHPARADGRVHDYDKAQKKIDYLTFPGN